MGETLLFIVKLLASALLMISCGVCHYVICTVVAKRAWSWRIMLYHAVVLAVDQFLSRLLNELHISTLLALITLFALAYWLYGARGMKWLSLGIRFLFGTLALELICAVVLYGISSVFGIPDSELFVITVHDLLNLRVLATSVLITDVMSLFVALLVVLLRKIVGFFSRKSPRHMAKYRLLLVCTRMLLLLLAGISMVMVATRSIINATQRGLFVEMGSTYMLMILSFCGFLALCLSYLVQDVRYLQQLSRNETLEQQQLINDSLLSSLRSFRHNMVNMLYGFEGAILSGDTAHIRNYYREMTEKCALVNNENIVALERVINPSVSAVLLQVLERAREAQLPINLYVPAVLRFSRAMPDSDLCEVLGVLLDNAIEAAMSAEVRYVSVEMRNVDDALEVIVKNTYAGEVTETQLLHSTASTKAGHSGQGLRSLREILSRNKKAFINMQVGSQYVSAQLLVLM